MKIISWNVNGIRAAIKKGLLDFLKEENPDIFCAQEIKSEKIEIEISDKYYQYWNPAQKKGYSGTVIFTKIEPKNIIYNIPSHETEGRVITAEFENFYLVNCYTPNSQRELKRLKYRMQWEEDFKKYLIKLDKKKPVILCGDLNVAHNEIDLKNPSNNKTTATKPGNAGFSDQEREKFTQLLNSGFIDTFRYFYPKKQGAYTWWSYMFNARANNSGWRIDYFCVSQNFISNVKDSLILSDILGSDHCPIKLLLK